MATTLVRPNPARPVLVEFFEWRDKNRCEQCGDHHESLVMMCDGNALEYSDGIDCNWRGILSTLFEYLEINATLETMGSDEEEGTQTVRITYGTQVREVVMWTDHHEASEDGPALVRTALEFVGLQPTVRIVDSEETID